MHARKRIGTLFGAALIAGAAAAAPAQAAALSCPAEPTQRVFERWYDPAHYVLVPGGDFEAAGWTLTGGAERVPGNEPWRVGGADDATALHLPAAATATSPPVCVAVDRPTLRFFARHQGSALGRVWVTALVPTLLGELRVPLGVVTDSGDGWAPTPPTLTLVNLLTVLGGPGDVRFELTAGVGSDWLVDDVYLDPYSKG